MEKENGDRDKSSAPGDANPLMDPLNVFAGHGIFGGAMPGGYHLSNAYNALLGGGRGGQFPPAPHPPTTSSYGSLGTLSVAASQAASLGINPASAAWWTMASHLAAQDYLARLQAAGMPFSGVPTDMSGFPIMSSQHSQGSGKQSQASHRKSPLSLGHGAHSTATSSHHRDILPSLLESHYEYVGERGGRNSRSGSGRQPQGNHKTPLSLSHGTHSTATSGHHRDILPSLLESHYEYVGERGARNSRSGSVKQSQCSPNMSPLSLSHGAHSTATSGHHRDILPSLLESHYEYVGERGGRNSRSVTGSGKQSQGSHSKSSLSLGHSVPSTATSSHHRDALASLLRDQHVDGYRGHSKQSPASHSKTATHSRSSPASAAASAHLSLPSLLNDPSGVLGGVRLPPDTEIIKYTSSIIGPKVPGTTNRGRKKTISLDPPSVSVTPTHSSPVLHARKHKLSPEMMSPMHPQHVQGPLALDLEHREADMSMQQPNVTNGQVTPQSSPVPAGYHTPPDCDAPLNLSLKPSSSSQTANNALQSLSSLSQSLGQIPDRISRRKPGPKPRRVTPSPLPPPGPTPSASLAQLFAAADSPHPPSSINEENDSATHHKDGRPRNLGRGVSKPKKNTVASLLAQSRALGLKPAIDTNSPISQQVNFLKANILQQHMQSADGESENEEKTGTTSPGAMEEDDIEKNQNLLQQASMKSLEELKALVQENFSETSSLPDVSTDSNSESESDSEADTKVSGIKRDGEPLQEEGPAKRRKVISQSKLQIPLDNGWKRVTVIKGFGKSGQIRGDVTYSSPCGHQFKMICDIAKFLQQNNITDMSKDNFTFSSKVVIGDYFHAVKGQEPRHLSEPEITDMLAERVVKQLKKDFEFNQVEREKMVVAARAREAKKAAKEEAARSKELARFIKEQEKSEKQEALRKEREQRNMQMLEARRKRQEEAGKLRQEEQHRKQQEREIKRQQTALLKEQIYIQELSKQRELLYTVELERERRRQHMTLVRSLETRRKIEDREKKRLEVKAEKLASREKRMEQRKIEMDLLSEIRKPVEDMELPDLNPLPELNRIPGLKLSGQAFADTLMVFEFLHNFGETLGFDMGSLPTLNSLQSALLGDEEAEEELLSVMTHLIICAIEDPGIPNPARHTTLLGQSLKQADITHSNISEILRIYLYANATGEVKSLTGVQFEREREKRMSDHHNNMNESAGEEPESGKNAAFFVALRENQTWKMSESLKHKPFLALNATHKTRILQFLCHELLQNKAVTRQIEGAIETVAQLKRDRWTNDSKLRKLRHLHNRKVRQAAIGMMGGKLSLEGVDDEAPPPKDHDDEEEGEGESGNESDGTQPEEEEDKKLSIEEMARKLERLNRQAEQTLGNLAESGGQLRAVCYGQDRYWRRYWSLPTAGGLFVEGMESAEPDLFEELLQEDADSMETPDIKAEYDAEALNSKILDDNRDDDEEMPHLTPEVDPETHLAYKERDFIHDKPCELTLMKDKEDNEKNGRIEEVEIEESQLKNECSGGEEDTDKLLMDEKKLQSFHFERVEDKSGEDSAIPNGQVEQEPAWFSVLPREPCDTTSVTSTASAFRCGIENSELRIPVFPPPPASPSPSQCDSPSPAPLAVTPEESVQLQLCKLHGLPRLAPAQPIPYEMRCGWWRITDTTMLQRVVECLHTRGAREKELRRTITRPCLDQNWGSTLKLCMRPGSSATELLVTENDLRLPQKIPSRDHPEEWNYRVALRVDMALLEQVEAMEDKVANASMQVKGWKVPPRASTEGGRHFRPSCSHPSPNLNPITVAKTRLADLESAIERRYLKPPLGIHVTAVDVNMSMSMEPDMVPKGLVIWRDAVSKSQTAAQLSMALHMLEASIAWDKSIMKANCQFCHSGDNEDKLLLCDGCDKGYHTYCFRPKMENIPEGDWYCFECMNKATGDKGCIVCGKKLGRNLVVCDNCPKAYHTDCLQPPISKVPRGKWHCPACFAKLPRKRLNAKRTISSSCANSTSPNSSLNRSYDDGSSSTAEPILSPMAPEDLAPDSPPPVQTAFKKEKSSIKKLAKEMAVCKILLDELESHDEAWPFLLPVNTKQFPTYKKIIKNPMDFSTIKKRLMECGGYKSREEFCSDVRLIFNNCETFNEDDSPVGKAGHSMRLFFETRWTDIIAQRPLL